MTKRNKCTAWCEATTAKNSKRRCCCKFVWCFPIPVTKPIISCSKRMVIYFPVKKIERRHWRILKPLPISFCYSTNTNTTTSATSDAPQILLYLFQLLASSSKLSKSSESAITSSPCFETNFCFVAT